LLRLILPGGFNPLVVARARRRFSTQILLALREQNADSTLQIYEKTLALPQTSTEAMLKIEGYELSGPWQTGHDNIVICFKNPVPHLLKALTPRRLPEAYLFSPF